MTAAAVKDPKTSDILQLNLTSKLFMLMLMIKLCLHFFLLYIATWLPM